MNSMSNVYVRFMITVIIGAINGLIGIPKTVFRYSFANETFR